MAINGSNKDVNDPHRHGSGLLTASKVFKRFLAIVSSDSKLPLGYIKLALVTEIEDVDPTTSCPLYAKVSRVLVRKLWSPAELESLLSSPFTSW